MLATTSQMIIDKLYEFQQTLGMSVSKFEAKFKELSRYALERARLEVELNQ